MTERFSSLMMTGLGQSRRRNLRNWRATKIGPPFAKIGKAVLYPIHNHPSGDPTPSQADITMTKPIVAIAEPLGISMHDHIIVGKAGHASLKGMRLI